MVGKRPVVIYGANGFSGRLVAEFLREYNVPFIAAGRDRAKLEAVMNHVPGIETADYEIAEIDGSANGCKKWKGCQCQHGRHTCFPALQKEN